MKVKQGLLSGVSFVIPFVAAGGVLIALSVAFAPMTERGPNFVDAPFLRFMYEVGSSSFALIIPVLAGFIAYGMAERQGLVPGFVGGYISNEIGAGFLGGMIAGIVAGVVVNLIRRVRVPTHLKPVMPIIVIPVLSSIIVGFVMFEVVGIPIREIMRLLSAWLTSVGAGNRILLGAVLGSMIAFDMGGPVNKVAYFFAVSMIGEGNYFVMGACAAAISIPPLGLGLATLIGKKFWAEEERKAGYAAIIMGLIGITEGAIPFAVGDPLRVIPSIMLGSMTGAMIAMFGRVGAHAPHGGPIVMPSVDNWLAFIIAIVVGSLVTALLVNGLKKWTVRSPQTQF